MSDPTELEVFNRFIESIKIASGCARQFGHMRKDERWIKICALLDGVRDKTVVLATRRSN